MATKATIMRDIRSAERTRDSLVASRRDIEKQIEELGRGRGRIMSDRAQTEGLVGNVKSRANEIAGIAHVGVIATFSRKASGAIERHCGGSLLGNYDNAVYDIDSKLSELRTQLADVNARIRAADTSLYTLRQQYAAAEE